MTSDVEVDIGALDLGNRRKALFLVIRSGINTYTVSLDVRGELLVTRKASDVYGFDRVPVESPVYSRLIAHALRRAICRGIDVAETHETDVAVLIDLGELPRAL